LPWVLLLVACQPKQAGSVQDSRANYKSATPPPGSIQYNLVNFPSGQHWVRSEDIPETPLVSAHRAKPETPGFPENSLEGIVKLVQSGNFILEIDVSMSKDSVLFLFHDDELERLTANRGLARERTWSELDTMRLLDAQGRLTQATIPSLEEALSLGKNKALFMLDRKVNVPLKLMMDALERLDMTEHAALILYDIDDFTEWATLREVGPISHEATSLLVIEELAQRSRELYKRVGISPFRENNWRPNAGFIGVGPPDAKKLAVAKTLGIKTVVGTFGELDRQAQSTKGQTYRDLASAGVSIIATNTPLYAHQSLYGNYVAKP
jgi:glycerophosphoryl diester phosphodiesterase